MPTRALPALRVNLLGAACWSRESVEAVPLQRRDAAVLAYLAIEGPTPRATLLELLWPDAATDVGRNHLRQRLHRLKQSAGIQFVEGAEILTLPAAIAVDVRELPPLEAADELLSRLDYGDCPQFDNWVVRQRARLRRAHADALAAQASLLEREERFAEAIALSEHLVAFAPLEEHAHRRLMQLHYLRGVARAPSPPSSAASNC